MDRPERTEQMSKVFGAVPPLADAVARVVAACGREAVFGAVQQRVVDADVVGAALHARLLEVEHARLPAEVFSIVSVLCHGHLKMNSFVWCFVMAEVCSIVSCGALSWPSENE
jgi:hypothetical protein